MFKSIANDIREPVDVIAGCVEIYDDVIAHPDNVIAISLAMEGWRDAEVYAHKSDSDEVNKEYRSNKILDINCDQYTTHPVFTYINDLVECYLQNYSNKYEVGYEYTEPAQLLHYSPGEFYKPHFDTGPAFPRVISALLYLNDVEDGGDTYFNNFSVGVQPKAGRLVIFPSNYAYTHQAFAPRSGDKFVIVYWTRERFNYE
jgi:Rps23 Pro-64 3,4-dihydroxylase Tpa1-like proline 4-hydroxylase